MKHISYFFASGAVTLALLAAVPALADSNMSLGGSLKSDDHAGLTIGSVGGVSNKDDGDKNDNGQGDNERDNHTTSTENGSVTLSGTVSAVSGSTLTLSGKDGATYSVNASGATVSGPEDNAAALADIRAGDRITVHGTLSGSSVVAAKIADSALVIRTFLSAIGAVGMGVVTSINGSLFTIKPAGTRATTTVTTDASTTFKVNGQATSSSALAVGSHVFLQGTSTGATSIAASLVSIFNFGVGFFKHWFAFR